MTTTIGIDPGSQLAGYCSSDGKLSGVWTLQGDCRWADLYGRVYTLAETCPKATFAVEEPNGHFMGKGWYVQAAWGCVMAALQFRGVKVVQVTNSAAKLALTGHGNADKSHMVGAAMAQGIERAHPDYWVAQGKTIKQALALAATAADAYAIALAGSSGATVNRTSVAI